MLCQKGFVNAVFEFGQERTLEGTLVKQPVPFLKIHKGNDLYGKAVLQNVLLVGFGKMGALPTLEAIEAKLGKSIDNQSVQLKGTLIYYDGKMAMELTGGVDSFIGFSNQNVLTSSVQSLGLARLRGEITDPKCNLGVMKPGYGKPHRSCAIRCISGGIPAVFKTENEAGESNYFLLLDDKGQPLSEAILAYVADQVQICGRVAQMDDWLVLYADLDKGIHRLAPYWMNGELSMCQ